MAGFEATLSGRFCVADDTDITVLSQDIMTVSEEEILDTRVLYTIVGGRIMYRGTQ
jgi:predicted amidohydrolase YtcJ